MGFVLFMVILVMVELFVEVIWGKCGLFGYCDVMEIIVEGRYIFFCFNFGWLGCWVMGIVVFDEFIMFFELELVIIDFIVDG